jgi:riboflavin kinase / FMN adenylyltransferase
MRLLRGVWGRALREEGTVATIGNFDGVHLGHQALLHALKKEARKRALPTLVVLFEPQPHEYFQGLQAPARLSNFKEKWHHLAHLGVDYVCCLRFNKTLASMTAEAFAEQLIFSRLRVKTLLIGQDFRFGAGRMGDVALLEREARQAGSKLCVYPEVLEDAARISSTRVRQALSEGELQVAAELLGRMYSIRGRVMVGAGLGRTFGVPTANIHLGRTVLPMMGVFCVYVRRMDGTLHQGVANLGRRPTVDGLSNSLEVHVFNFDGSLYGEVLHVFFVHRLRGEKKFPSLDVLIDQIKCDIVEAKALFPRLINKFPVRVMS